MILPLLMQLVTKINYVIKQLPHEHQTITLIKKNPRYANASQPRTTSNQSAPTGNNANRQNKPFNYTRLTRKLSVCYNCGTPGHYARDCTSSHFQ